MSLNYHCEECNHIINSEELLDDSYLEELIDAKRCPQCGNSINLNSYIIDNTVTDDDINSIFPQNTSNFDTMNPDDD